MARKLPVVDGDIGADIYGYATTKAGAIRVGKRHFVDGCVDAYRAENVTDWRGQNIGPAWVALTPYGAKVMEG